MKLLIERGGKALDLDAQSAAGGETALCWALLSHRHQADIVRMLLDAGADPSIPKRRGRTPLDRARARFQQPCIALLETALADSHRVRLLLKARTLLDLAHHGRQILLGHGDDGQEGDAPRPRPRPRPGLVLRETRQETSGEN